jgi:transcriptional regulator with XRE-family HTH domain
MGNNDKTPGERHDDRRTQVCGAFGELTNRLRTDRRLTQEQLAERSGLATDMIKRLEKGRFSPSLHTMGKLALGLDMRLSEIFDAFERQYG